MERRELALAAGTRPLDTSPAGASLLCLGCVDFFFLGHAVLNEGFDGAAHLIAHHLDELVAEIRRTKWARPLGVNRAF